MNDSFETGLRDYLARCTARAARETSPQRVLEEVELRIAHPGVRSRRALTGAVALMALVVIGVAVAGSLGLRSRTATTGHDATEDYTVRGPIPSTPPPPGIALAWVADPANHGRIVAYDWHGRAVGSLTFPSLEGELFAFNFLASPDGSRLLIQALDGRSQWLVSSQGQRLGELPTPPWANEHYRQIYPSRWSDDGSSVCVERLARDDYAHAPRSLWVADGAGRQRRVAEEAPPDAPPDVTWQLAACSVRSDRAVVVGYHVAPAPSVAASTPTVVATRSGNVAIIRMPQRFAVAPRFTWVAMVRVIRLSDGAELSRRSYAPDSVRTVSVSADTRVWIETSTQDDTTAIDYSTGRRYALGKMGTVGFAGLPDTVLATDWDSKAKVSGIRFIDWRTGEVLGRRTVRGSGGLVAVEPGGLGLLLDSAIPQPCGEINDIEILDDSGALVQLVQQSRICPTDTPRPR